MCTSLFAEQIVNGQLDVSIHIQEVWDQTAVNVEIALYWRTTFTFLEIQLQYNDGEVKCKCLLY